MKRVRCAPLVLSICLCCIGCNVAKNYQLSDSPLDEAFWSFYSSDPGSQMQDVWTEQDGILVCSGSPLGYLYSKADFDDFVLKLQWRWPADKAPGKGGVLIHMTGEHKVWPKSLEAQINAGDAGDFWGLDGYQLSGPIGRTRAVDHEKFGQLTNVKKTQALEKRPGEWNTYEIRAEGDTVTLTINGIVVNQAAGCAPTKGKICLTAEGSEIHFRNIEIGPLTGR